MRTNIRVIEIFVRDVESGSFIAAARSLLIDPAAVSRAIKGLEEALGVLLFTRSTRVLKLTAEGKRFHRDGAQMLRNFEETIRRFQADTTVQRQLKVGMGPALSRRMMLRAIPSFQERHPQVRLMPLGINDPAEIRDEGIAVLIPPRSTRRRGAEHRQPQGLIVRRLMQSPIMVCASPDYLQRRGVPREVGWHFARFGAHQKIKFAPTLTAHGDELREAALAGCGIVRLLACHVEDEIRSGALVPVLTDWECLGGLPIVAIYRKTRPALSPVNAFVGHLAQAFRRYEAARASPRF